MWYTPITLITSFFVGYTAQILPLCILFHQRKKALLEALL